MKVLERISQACTPRVFQEKNHPMYGSSRTGTSNPFFGKTHNNETRKRLSEVRDGMIVAKDIKTGKKLWVTKEEFESDRYVGITAGNSMSNEARQKISTSLKNKLTLTCPHCGKEGKANMTRYHFENCKKYILANNFSIAKI